MMNELPFYKKRIFKIIYLVLLLAGTAVFFSSIRKDTADDLNIEIEEQEEVFCTGPFMLYPGDYVIGVDYRADRDTEFFFATDYGEQRFPAVLPSDETAFQFPVHMEDYSDLCHLGFPGYDEDSFEIKGLKVYSSKPLYYDAVLYGLIFFLTGLALLFILNGKWFAGLSLFEKSLFLTLCFYVLLSCVPLFQKNILDAWDDYAHWMRIDGIASCLKDGRFPAVIYPYSANGFGQLGILYPQLFLYPSAFLRVLHVSAPAAMHFLFMLTNAATAFCAYLSARAIFEERSSALIFSALYVLVPYRLTDIYDRCSVGESTALIFIPLVFAGLYLLCTTDSPKTVAYLSIGAVGILASHFLTLVIVAIFSFVVVLINIEKILNVKKILTCLKAFLFILGIGAFILGPLVFFMHFGLNNNILMTDWCMRFTHFYELFMIRDFTLDVPESDVSVIGLITIVSGIVLLIKYIATKNRGKQKSFFIRIFILMLILTAMTLVEFPWENLNRFNFVRFYTEVIQFPYRLMTSACVIYCYVAVCAVNELFKGQRRYIAAAVFVLAAVICVTPTLFAELGDEVIYTRSDGGQTRSTLPEYFPKGALESEHRYDRLYLSGEGVSITDYNKDGADMSFTYATFNDGEYIELPVFYYPGYTAKTAEGQELKVEMGGEHRLRVYLPPSGLPVKVEAFYRLPLIIPVSYVISILSLILLCLKKRSSVPAVQPRPEDDLDSGS